MKIAAMIARYLLGLLFLVFGLNGFLSFIPMGPLPVGLQGDYVRVLMQSHYTQVVSAFELAGAVLLLANRYVPLALTLLGPVIVNILIFHLLMAPATIVPGLVVTILWGLVATRNWQHFSGLFVQRTDS